MKAMKKFVLAVILALAFQNFLCAQNNDETLLKVAGEDISKAEFLRVYNKNNINNEAITKKSIEDYLELYINFKLKVKEAENQKLDTSAAFKKELEGYRKQLAKPYLVDSEVTEQLMKEAYERMKYDLRASHILIKINEDATPEDTLKAYNKAIKIYDRLMKGESFEQLAVAESDDPSAKDMQATPERPARKGNKGDIGYFSAFNMVYPFENAAYKLKVGEISKPVKTAFGYHIIKLTDKHEAMGVATTAHIFLKTDENTTPEDAAKIKQLAFNIYDSLANGKDFGAMARQYSEDKGSANNGGKLIPFAANKIIPEFVTQIYKLNPGEISKPFSSYWGWHIVKLISVTKSGSYEEEKDKINDMLKKDYRISLSKQAAYEKIKKDYELKVYKNTVEDFYATVDTTRTWNKTKAANLNKTMFTIGNASYNQQDFAAYLEKKFANYMTKQKGFEQQLNNTFDSYVEETCFDYADKHLEEAYPDFKNLMKEYRDGMLLFEITDRMVWTKAVQDTAGLQAFYEQNKSKYMWGERLEAKIYACKDEETAKAVIKLIKKNAKNPNSDDAILKALNATDNTKLKIESGKYSKNDNAIIDQIQWQTGISQPIKAENKVFVVDGKSILAPQNKSLNEAKGLITADYQDFLEKQWISQLRSKYPYKVNENVLSTIK